MPTPRIREDRLALRRYRLRLRALIAALASDEPTSRHNAPVPALEDLGVTIETDIGAHAAIVGQARMSQVERRVLVSPLVRPEKRLTGLGPSL